MKQLYVPILRARKGEFDALFNLSKRASRRILPLPIYPESRNLQRGRMQSQLKSICRP